MIIRYIAHKGLYMNNKPISTENLVFHPLTPSRWDDFTTLFGSNGATTGCWCMYWRTTRSQFNTNGSAGNKQAMKELVHGGTIPGIIGFQDGQPVAWCSIAPREDFASLDRSPVLKRFDDQPVWSIVCFFIHRKARHKGLMKEVIQGAVAFAAQNGAKIVEAYPVEPKERHSPGELYMGIVDIFLNAGFEEIEPRGSHKFMRLSI